MADRFAWWFVGATCGLFLTAYLFVSGVWKVDE
ncbi:membrane protein [Mycobacterium phage Chaser]|nr:membrane protein [Mycobacterium phage Chaser]